MKKSIILIVLCLFTLGLNAQQKKIWNETEQEKVERLSWWTNDRFGMFIHWGTYSLAGRHKWVKQNERTDNETYQKYFENFNPDLYNPHGYWAKEKLGERDINLSYPVSKPNIEIPVIELILNSETK